MLSTIWCPWEDNKTKAELKAENQDKVSKKPAVSETCFELFVTIFAYQCLQNVSL